MEFLLHLLLQIAPSTETEIFDPINILMFRHIDMSLKKHWISTLLGVECYIQPAPLLCRIGIGMGLLSTSQV